MRQHIARFLAVGAAIAAVMVAAPVAATAATSTAVDLTCVEEGVHAVLADPVGTLLADIHDPVGTIEAELACIHEVIGS